MYYRRKWPWIAQQTWKDIVFLHWPVQVQDLRPHIPAPLQIDQYQNKAWVSIVFFKAEDSRPRSFSPLLSYPPFDQLNVRTYVKFASEPGVHFFTLHANDPLIVKGAKLMSLPYVKAKISHTGYNDQQRKIISSQVDIGSPPLFSAQYSPDHQPYIAEKGSLANWLTERYCIWLINDGKIMKAPLTHLPWVLYDVDINISKMNGLLPFDKTFKEKPIAQYAYSMTTYAHPFEQFGVYKKT